VVRQQGQFYDYLSVSLLLGGELERSGRGKEVKRGIWYCVGGREAWFHLCLNKIRK
jgi:hypothetical protein